MHVSTSIFPIKPRPLLLLKYIIREYFEVNKIPENKQWNATCKSSTAYGALRGHLERYHEKEYLKACQENGWKVLLPTWLKKEKATFDATLQETKASRVSFTQEEFLQHLVNWIVANDQVRIWLIISSYFDRYFTQSLRVVEVPELCRLLVLLQEELSVEGIPGRTKIRSAIMESLEDFFKSLKNELQVLSV